MRRLTNVAPWTRMRCVVRSALFAAAFLSAPSLGAAQPSIASIARPSRPLALRPSWALALSDPPPEPIVVVHGPPTEEGLRLRRAERRLDGGYALLGAGAGLAGGAAFLGARFGRPGYCHVDGGPTYVRTARIAAGVVGGVGVALAFTGTGLVLAVPRADRRAIGTRRSSRLLQAGVTVAGLVGGFALGFATVFLSSLGGPGGLIACSNS